MSVSFTCIAPNKGEMTPLGLAVDFTGVGVFAN